jgi:hypothetical protein
VRRAIGLAAAALLGAAVTSGAGLDDLRTALEKLRAREPLRARITQENSGEFRDDGQKRTRHGRASILAEDDGESGRLRLVYDAATLSQAERQPAGQRDSRGPEDAVRDLDAVRVLGLLRPAEKLLHDLTGASLISDSADLPGGRPARVVELRLASPPGLDREKGFTVTRSARFWLDPSGVPISSEIRTHTEVRRLIFKVHFHTTEKNQYAVAGQRLVTTRRDTENRWKAWIIAEGSNQSVTTVETVE